MQPPHQVSIIHLWSVLLEYHAYSYSNNIMFLCVMLMLCLWLALTLLLFVPYRFSPAPDRIASFHNIPVSALIFTVALKIRPQTI